MTQGEYRFFFLIVESGELVKHITGSSVDETEMEMSAGNFLLILMLPMLCDTKGRPKRSPC